MLVKSQIKFWVFGAVGAFGVYLLTTAWFGDRIGLGLTFVVSAVGAIILGVTWNFEKSNEKAVTYHRLARDERAKQEWHKVAAEGAKQLENSSVVVGESADVH